MWVRGKKGQGVFPPLCAFPVAARVRAKLERKDSLAAVVAVTLGKV